jgi:hypothetical protein
VAKAQILKCALVVQFSLCSTKNSFISIPATHIISLTRRRYFFTSILLPLTHRQITPTPPTPLIFIKKFQGNQITYCCFFESSSVAATDNNLEAANFSNVK